MCSSVLLFILRSVRLCTKGWRRDALHVAAAAVSEQQVPSDDKLMNRKLSPASITGRQRVLHRGGGNVAPTPQHPTVESSNKSQLSNGKRVGRSYLLKLELGSFFGI